MSKIKGVIMSATTDVVRSSFRSSMPCSFDIDTIDLKNGFVSVNLRVETAALLSRLIGRNRDSYKPLHSLGLSLRTAAEAIYHENIDWQTAFNLNNAPITAFVVNRDGVEVQLRDPVVA